MRGIPMGDAPFNPPLVNDESLHGTTAKGDQILGLISAGWTNERHSTYISSMEASFVDQLYGLRKHGPPDHEGGGQTGSTWVRRSRQHNNTAVNRHGDVMEAVSIDGYGSGTDSVRKKVHTYGIEAMAGAQENLIGKSKEVSDQNFSEEDVEADDEPCKRRRPTSTSAEPT